MLLVDLLDVSMTMYNTLLQGAAHWRAHLTSLSDKMSWCREWQLRVCGSGSNNFIHKKTGGDVEAPPLPLCAASAAAPGRVILYSDMAES